MHCHQYKVRMCVYVGQFVRLQCQQYKVITHLTYFTALQLVQMCMSGGPQSTQFTKWETLRTALIWWTTLEILHYNLCKVQVCVYDGPYLKEFTNENILITVMSMVDHIWQIALQSAQRTNVCVWWTIVVISHYKIQMKNVHHYVFMVDHIWHTSLQTTETCMCTIFETLHCGTKHVYYYGVI